MPTATGWSAFLALFFTNEFTDSFITNLGATLVLNQFAIAAGPLTDLLLFFLKRAIAFLMTVGVFQIDLALDSLLQGMKLDEFKAIAQAEYDKATAKVYTDEQKAAIRAEYLSIIEKIGPVGAGP